MRGGLPPAGLLVILVGSWPCESRAAFLKCKLASRRAQVVEFRSIKPDKLRRGQHRVSPRVAICPSISANRATGVLVAFAMGERLLSFGNGGRPEEGTLPARAPADPVAALLAKERAGKLVAPLPGGTQGHALNIAVLQAHPDPLN